MPTQYYETDRPVEEELQHWIESDRRALKQIDRLLKQVKDTLWEKSDEELQDIRNKMLDMMELVHYPKLLELLEIKLGPR